MLTGIPCTLMRGGTSKGLYFDEKDLPAQRELRDRVLLAAMGSPDLRQIDGVGGAHPLTSKVAVLSRATQPGADVDYLFLQVVVDGTVVSIVCPRSTHGKHAPARPFSAADHPRQQFAPPRHQPCQCGAECPGKGHTLQAAYTEALQTGT